MKQFLLISLVLASINFANAQGWGQTQKITALDRAGEDEFGYAVAMDGDYAVIGARLDNNPTIDAGSVYIFKNDGNGNWVEAQKLQAPDKRSSDFFGTSVAINANTIMVGARNQDYNENNQEFKEAAGAVYFFEKDGTDTWNFTQKVVAPDRAASDVFGESVAISGDYAIVMAPLEDEDENGQNTINATGSGYVFERDGSGTWNFVQKIVDSDRAEANTIGREGSVDIDGNTIVIGVQLDDTDENNINEVINAGAVYMFERNGAGIWNQTQKLVASTRFEGDAFGTDVALNGDTMIVGANLKNVANTDSGSAYVFKKVGGIWQELQQLAPSSSDFEYRFGKTVDIEGDRLVVGAFNEELNGFSFAGAAYVYEKDGSDVWNQVARIGALDAEASDNFSYDIAISGDFVIGGAYREDEDENGQNPLSRSGSAYVFDVNEPNTIPTLSIAESEFTSVIEAYPNPFTNTIHLDFGQPVEALSLAIYDVLGKQVFSQNYNQVQHIKATLNLSEGIYLLKAITNQNESSVIKLIKY